MFLGARYYEFNDNFNVFTGENNGTTTVPSFLGGSYWDTQAANHVIGPQIGLRWFRKQGRWTFNTEGRFFAGVNCQSIYATGRHRPQSEPGAESGRFLYAVRAANDVAHHGHTLSPMPWSSRRRSNYGWKAGIRLPAPFPSMPAGRACGWTASPAPAAWSCTQVPAMGIDMTDNRQSIFVNGLTLGFDVNR